MSNGWEPSKWEINPEATLRELGRMEDDPGYSNTICGIHRILWTVVNIDAAGHIPEDILDRLNELLETAYRMGKRMDYRLHEYHKREHGDSETNLNALFVSEVQFPVRQLQADVKRLEAELRKANAKLDKIRKSRKRA